MKREVGWREAETSTWVKQLGSKSLRKAGLKHLSQNASYGKLLVAGWWLVAILSLLVAVVVVFFAWRYGSPLFVLLGVLAVAVPMGFSVWLGRLWSTQQAKTAAAGDEFERLGFAVTNDTYGVDWGFKRPLKAFVALSGRTLTAGQLEGVLTFLGRSLPAGKGFSWVPVLGEDYGDWAVFEISSDEAVISDSQVIRSAWPAFVNPAAPVTVGRNSEGELATIWVRAYSEDLNFAVTENRLDQLLGGRWAASWLPESEVMQYELVDESDPVFARRELLPSIALCVSTAASHNLSASDRVFLADVDWVDNDPRVVTVIFDTPEIANIQLRDPLVEMLARNLAFTFPGSDWVESWGRNGNQPVLFMSNNTVG